MRAWWIGGCLAVGCMGLYGCSRSQPASTNPVQNVTEEAERTPQGTRRTGDAAAFSRPFQPGAAGAVEVALDGFRTGHLETAYDFLPPAYQQDVNRLTQDFAKEVDPELWNEILTVTRKGVHVLRVKKSLLLSMFPQPGGAPSPHLDHAWDEFVNAAEQLVRNDYTRLERLQDVDVRELLRKDISGTLRRLLTLTEIANPGGRNPFTELEHVAVDLVESTPSTALVRITPMGKSDVTPTEFMKVDGRWIPKSLAENWVASIEATRTQIQLLSKQSDPKQFEPIRNWLHTLDQVFEQMLATESTDQLVAAAMPLLLSASQWQTPLPANVPSVPEGPPEGVSLLISRELPDEELTRLLQLLEPLTDDPLREYHLATANGGKTYVSIKPVKHIAEFAEKLTFAKDVVVDETARTITARDVLWK